MGVVMEIVPVRDNGAAWGYDCGQVLFVQSRATVMQSMVWIERNLKE